MLSHNAGKHANHTICSIVSGRKFVSRPSLSKMWAWVPLGCPMVGKVNQIARQSERNDIFDLFLAGKFSAE